MILRDLRFVFSRIASRARAGQTAGRAADEKMILLTAHARRCYCGENNEHVFIRNEAYFLSADGYLMPTRKDQPPPDARYFATPTR